MTEQQKDFLYALAQDAIQRSLMTGVPKTDDQDLQKAYQRINELCGAVQTLAQCIQCIAYTDNWEMTQEYLDNKIPFPDQRWPFWEFPS